MRIKEQSLDYLDSNITDVFHFLELKGEHNYIIGSCRIRNILYANDYDLNSRFNTTESRLTQMYKEFKQMHEKAMNNPDYYILDFKCGMVDDEPIRWKYKDVMKGTILFQNKLYTFEECLQHPNNLIKLDICFLQHDIFTDINCVYKFHIVKNVKDLNRSKNEERSKTKKEMLEEIKVLTAEGEYYKVMKKYFSLSKMTGEIDESLMNIINSDYGMFYKFISFMKLVEAMINQTFKPVSVELIVDNLEYIKEFASHITTLNIDKYLIELIALIKYRNKKKIGIALEALIEKCKDHINEAIRKEVEGLKPTD